MNRDPTKYCISVLNNYENDLWDEWVINYFKGSIYHNINWLKAMELNSGMKLQLLAVWPIKKEKIPLAILPVFNFKKWPLRAAFSPAPGCDTPYLGPLFKVDLDSHKNKLIIPEIQSALVDYLLNQGVNFIKLRTTPDQQDFRGFLWTGCQVRPQYEYEVNIGISANQLFQDFPGDTRTKIRRAQKYDQLEFQFGGIDCALEVFYLIRERFKEQGIQWQLKESYIKNIFKSFHPSKVQAVIAKYDGEAIGGLVFYKHNDSLVDWIGGVNPKQNISGLNELLHWKIIEWGQQNRCSTYNLGGANTMHLCKPKSKYSPELVNYSEITKGTSIYALINNIAKWPVIRNFLHKIK